MLCLVGVCRAGARCMNLVRSDQLRLAVRSSSRLLLCLETIPLCVCGLPCLPPDCFGVVVFPLLRRLVLCLHPSCFGDIIASLYLLVWRLAKLSSHWLLPCLGTIHLLVCGLPGCDPGCFGAEFRLGCFGNAALLLVRLLL